MIHHPAGIVLGRGDLDEVGGLAARMSSTEPSVEPGIDDDQLPPEWF